MCDQHGFTAVFFEERLGAHDVVVAENYAVFFFKQLRSEAFAYLVADIVTGDGCGGDDYYGCGQRKRAGGGQYACAQKQRVTGEEKTDHHPRLSENNGRNQQQSAGLYEMCRVKHPSYYTHLSLLQGRTLQQGPSLQYTAGMPSRNRNKVWVPGEVYHVYNRGNNKQPIFLDEQDYAVFLNIIKLSLQEERTTDKFGRPRKNWYGDIELLAFCLMPNHFHLLLYQKSERAISDFMRGLATSYTGYMNHKYDWTGHLFQGVFKASHIDENSYWLHISRYIHLNPKAWRTWEWSSLPYYTQEKQADWVRPDRIAQAFPNGTYLGFVADYESHKDMLDELKHITAD